MGAGRWVHGMPVAAEVGRSPPASATQGVKEKGFSEEDGPATSRMDVMSGSHGSGEAGNCRRQMLLACGDGHGDGHPQPKGERYRRTGWLVIAPVCRGQGGVPTRQGIFRDPRRPPNVRVQQGAAHPSLHDNRALVQPPAQSGVRRDRPVASGSRSTFWCRTMPRKRCGLQPRQPALRGSSCHHSSLGLTAAKQKAASPRAGLCIIMTQECVRKDRGEK